MENPDQAPEAVAEEIVAPVEGEAAVEQVAEPVAEEPAIEAAPVVEAPEVVEEAAEDDHADASVENVVDGLIDGDTPVAMSHPDGGTSDAYETDAHGNLLVPASDVPVMISHGFVVEAAE